MHHSFFHSFIHSFIHCSLFLHYDPVDVFQCCFWFFGALFSRSFVRVGDFLIFVAAAYYLIDSIVIIENTVAPFNFVCSAPQHRFQDEVEVAPPISLPALCWCSLHDFA